MNTKNSTLVAYHVTPAFNVSSILTHGIRPFIGERAERLGEFRERSYLFPDKESLITGLSNWLGDELEADYGNDCEIRIIAVDVGRLHVQQDAEYELCVTQTIPSNSIVGVYHLDGELTLIPDETYKKDIDGRHRAVKSITGDTVAVSGESLLLVYRGEHGALPDINNIVPNAVVRFPEYYSTPGARELAHAVKSGDPNAIKQMAQEMAVPIPEGAILVPVPGRNGIARQTLLLANEIAKIKNAIVENVLSGVERESLYWRKKQGEPLLEESLGLSLRKPLQGDVWLVDTVIDTGATMAAAKARLPEANVIVHSVHAKPIDRMQSKLPMFTFSNVDAAEVYALDPNDSTTNRFEMMPRVYAGYLAITKPVIDNRDDPFFDMSIIEEKFGRDTAVYFAYKHGGYIEHTNNWCELSEETGCSSVQLFLYLYPERVTELYLDAFSLLDDPEFIELIKVAGFDGAIHLGNGVSAAEEEFKIISEHQFIPYISPMNAITHDAVLFRRTLIAKQEIIADMESGIVPTSIKAFEDLQNYVDANMYVNDSDRKDNLIGLLGKKEGWEQENYIRFTNQIIARINTWLAESDLAAHPIFTKPTTVPEYVHITLCTETDAFEDLGERFEIVRIIKDAVADVRVWNGDIPIFLTDTNGNNVGKIETSTSYEISQADSVNLHVLINLAHFKREADNVYQALANSLDTLVTRWSQRKVETFTDAEDDNAVINIASLSGIGWSSIGQVKILKERCIENEKHNDADIAIDVAM